MESLWPQENYGIDWRLFYFPPGGNDYIEYTNLENVEGFRPGIAFWLITKTDFIIKAPAGMTVSTTEPFYITLQPGWNDIANPWIFDISWDKKENPEDDILYIYFYEKEWSDPLNMHYILEPWKRYAVYNPGQSSVFIGLRSELTQINEKSVVNSDTEIWRLTLKASAGDAKDSANHLGVRKDSQVEWDCYDHVEPPPVGKYVSVSFPHQDWKVYPSDYTMDFRPPGNTISWDFDVITNISGETVTIKLEGIEQLPDEYFIKIIDRDNKRVIDTANNTFSFISVKNPTERHLRLVVSDSHEPEELSSRPEQLITATCYPNPFNPQTTIRYELSHQEMLLFQYIMLLASR